MTDRDQPHRLRYFIVTFAMIGGLIFAVGIVGFLKLSSFGKANLHVFVTPSNSMCPTLCEGERFFADFAAYSTHSPARGDVIAYRYIAADGKSSIFTKRVIGVAGDKVSADQQGNVLVNGSPLVFPPVCGTPPRGSDPGTVPVLFPSKIVPEGSLFLIGDNLANSFDSRIPGFVAAKTDQVLGKLLMIYWSPGSWRIGCSIR